MCSAGQLGQRNLSLPIYAALFHLSSEKVSLPSFAFGSCRITLGAL